MPFRVTIQTEMDMTNTLHHAMVSFAAMVFHHVPDGPHARQDERTAQDGYGQYKIACEDAVREIHKLFVRRGKPWADTQIGFIAMDVQGRVGGFALRPGFSFAVAQGDGVEILEANSLLNA